MTKQNKVKIAVAFHKETPIDNFIKNKEIYIPIFGGRELYNGNSPFLLNMQGDNIGENISTLNPFLNEGTVLYWFAKNVALFNDPDYIGFNHYRRFLNFNLDDLNENTIIASKYNLLYFSVSEQLCHKEIDINRLNFYVEFIANIFKQDEKLMQQYFTSKEYYVANMFIMPKNIFEEYKKFLFALIDFSILILKYQPQFIALNQRVLAMLLERMTGFFLFKKEREGINIIDKGIIVPQNEQDRFREFYLFGNYFYINEKGEYIKVK